MDYDSKNTGGVGYEIVFPEGVELENIKKIIGRYEGANIERIELEAILQGMNEVIKIYKSQLEKLRDIKTIIFTTDRFSLRDSGKTSPYRIKEWRKNNWHNYEGKAIKNSDLLEKIDKTRKKIVDKLFCVLKIEYLRRKYNKVADKLAKAGKKEVIRRGNIALKGIKIGKRMFEGEEIDYRLLKEKNEHGIHIYKKELIRDQWEISVEFCKGKYIGKKIKIYSDSKIERKLHRRHAYQIRIKKVYSHHLEIYKTVKEIKIVKNENQLANKKT